MKLQLVLGALIFGLWKWFDKNFKELQKEAA